MSEKITFEAFAERISIETATDIGVVKDYLYTLFDVIKEENEKNNWVKIRNFGSFHPVLSKEKMGINPQTGEKILIPEHYHIHFTPAKKLSTLVNAKYSGLHSTEIPVPTPPKTSEPVIPEPVVSTVSIPTPVVPEPVAPEPTTSTPKILEPDVPETKENNKSRYFLIFSALFLVVGVLIYFLFSQKEVPQAEIKIEPLQKKYVEPAKIVEKRVIEKEAPPAISKEDITKEKVIPVKTKEKIAIFKIYTVARNDTLSGISKKKYGIAYFWPLIYSINKDIILDQDYIYPGMKLKIPDTVETQTTKDIKRLEHAFIDAYINYKDVGKVDKAHWILYTG